jgi:hypothetical protein
MRICEYAFTREDPDNPGYSMHEVDYYAWVPATRGSMPNHRLSLRRNLVEKRWEFYRMYNKTVVLHGYGESVEVESWQVITHKPTGIEEIAFVTKDFKEALRWGNNEWNRWHKTPGYTREDDLTCDHGNNRSLSCPVKNCKFSPCEYMGNCPNPGHPEIWCYYDELDKETRESRADNRKQETA